MPLIQTVSRKSFDRIHQLIKSVTGHYSFVHQTLTFPAPVFELPLAKQHLKKVLDLIHRQFEIASIYVFERHSTGAWHIHLLFFFFAPQAPPPAVPRTFSREVFAWWNKIHEGKCVRAANKATFPSKLDPQYLLKSACVEFSPQRNTANWWGYRNKRLLSVHQAEKPKKGVRRKRIHLPDFDGQLRPRGPFYSRHLEDAKKQAREEGISWAAFKMRGLRRSTRVSDKQFLARLHIFPESLFIEF